jgi:uncharacterized repeat protein (TIGR02543 family)
MTDRAVISGNSATSYGGGIQNTDNGLLHISGDAVISNNSARYGGGIFTMSTLPNAVTINGGTIANNTANNNGGGIYTNSQLTMTNGIIANNTAAVNGGGIYIASAGFVELLTGSVYGNIADNNGGGIWVAYMNLNNLFVFDGVVFSNNQASMAYNRNPIDDALYHAQIGANVVWTTPFTQGYNNYDISYSNDPPATLYTVIYDPGTQGTWQANDETYTDLAIDVSTPVFGTNSGADTAVDHTDGYQFAGWLPTWSATVSGDIIYVAQWTKITEPIFYSITYNGNGHTSGFVPIDYNSPYLEGNYVVVLDQGDMAKTGYTFLGWSTNPTANTATFTAGDTFTIYSDIVLYAVWTENTYTVTYQPGTHGTFKEQTTSDLHYGDPTPAAPTITGETGWTFTDWQPTLSATVTGDVIYIAQWTQETTTPTPTPTPTITATPTPSPTITAKPTPTPTASAT